MKDLSENKIRQIFNEGLEQLVLPILDDIYKNMATKEDIKKIREEMATKEDLEVVKKELKEDISFVQTDVDSIKRTLNAEVSWRDDASKRLKKIEVNIGLAK